MRKLLAFALLLAMAGSIAACNTIAGAGTDVSKAGNAVTNTSDKVKDKL